VANVTEYLQESLFEDTTGTNVTELIIHFRTDTQSHINGRTCNETTFETFRGTDVPIQINKTYPAISRTLI